MAAQVSAGLLMYRIREGHLEVFLVHPGGPYFRNKDDGWWSIPKGLVEAGEDLLETAKREFEEETGIRPEGELISLDWVKQKGGKVLHAWAFKGDWNGELKSNYFQVEWPPRSGRMQQFPEIDRAEFFPVEVGKHKINAAQVGLIERLEDKLGRTGSR